MAASDHPAREPRTYPPLDTLKPIADDVWIVDGPLIDFGPWPVRMAFPTRMTIVRIGGRLFLHSPTRLTAALCEEIMSLGEPAWIVGPNRIHYWWIPEWREAFAGANVYLAPRIRAQSAGRIDFPAEELDHDRGYPWDCEIATLPVAGRYMTEVVFFHRPSRTLILTDLIENFEPKKMNLLGRLLIWVGGVRDPHGSMPRDMRATFSHHRDGLRNAVETMLSWSPERIVLAHGRWYPANGEAELRRAFRWLLD